MLDWATLIVASSSAMYAAQQQGKAQAEATHAAKLRMEMMNLHNRRPDIDSLAGLQNTLGEMYRQELQSREARYEPVNLAVRYGMTKPQFAPKPRVPTFGELKKHNLRRARAAWKGTDK